MEKRISIIGGDRRNIELYKLLKEECDTKIYAVKGDNINNVSTLEEALDTDIIVCGIPCSLDGETINASEKISYMDLFNAMKKGQKLFGGVINEKIISLAEKKEIECFDFMKSEEFAILNAIPTAEGAIEIAIREMPITIHNANVLILGFGRIGKLLAKMLDVIGANLTVAARKPEDFAWINAYKYNGITYSELNENIGKYDVIFNTVPSIIIDEERIKLLDKQCLIIDLASKPGGVNLKAAEKEEIKVVWALGLPGKSAPVSAAKYMKEVIYRNLYRD